MLFRPFDLPASPMRGRRVSRGTRKDFDQNHFSAASEHQGESKGGWKGEERALFTRCAWLIHLYSLPIIWHSSKMPFIGSNCQAPTSFSCHKALVLPVRRCLVVRLHLLISLYRKTELMQDWNLITRRKKKVLISLSKYDLTSRITTA